MPVVKCNVLPEIQDNQYVFLVPSVISIKHPDISRNIYSRIERFDQTVKQLHSIQTHFPSSCTIVLESSADLTLEEILILQYYSDAVYLFMDNTEVMFYAHEEDNRNFTEVILLLFILNELKTKNFKYSHICKFGGRYWFDTPKDSLFQNKPVFKQGYAECHNCICTETVFYSLPSTYVQSFCKHLEWMLSILKSYPVTDNERLLSYYLVDDIDNLRNRDFNNPNIINFGESIFGIKGYQAPTGMFRVI